MSQTAILRVLVDLIKADSLIEATEMNEFYKIISDYHISTSHLRKVSSMTLSQAVCELKSPDFCQQERNDLLKKLRDITLVDGFCIKEEALLLVALFYCLLRETKVRAEIISVYIPDIDIAKDQVLYIESEDNEHFQKDIEENYRLLNAEFKCSGLKFLYIPKIAEHISNTDSKLFKDVCRFIAPDFDDEELGNMISYFKDVTTSKFCKDMLFGKLMMSSVHNTTPGILVHVGKTHIEGKQYDNFLKLSFDETISATKQLQAFLETYTNILSYDAIVIPKDEDKDGAFRYSGFYKFLYDLYLVKNQMNSSILIDEFRQGIFFPQIGRDFELNVSRREKALYLMIILESRSGGIMFGPSEDEKETEKRIKSIKNKFRFLYTRMGGDYDNVPDITNSGIRNPSMAHINTFFKNSENIFVDNEKYQIKKLKKDGYSFYYVDFDREQIYIRESVDGEQILIYSSEMFNQYRHQ